MFPALAHSCRRSSRCVARRGGGGGERRVRAEDRWSLGVAMRTLQGVVVVVW